MRKETQARHHGLRNVISIRSMAFVVSAICLLSSVVLPVSAFASTVAIGSQVEVVGTSGDGLNVRSFATTSAPVITVEKEGSRGVVGDGPVSAGGFVWWSICWKDGITGWSASAYLKLAPPSNLPGVPTGLRATPGIESVVLSWSDPEDKGTTPVTAWRIYRGQQNNPTILVATLKTGDDGFAEHTWTDGPLLLGGESYFYSVSAVDASGEGTSCVSVITTPKAAMFPHGLFVVPPLVDIQQGMDSMSLCIQNVGTEPLSFTIVPYASWITNVTPLYATIPVSGSQTLTVNISRDGLKARAYEGILRITSGGDSVNIPVKMRVGMIQGIDVSRYQSASSPINWVQVRASGIQFAFVKATEGTEITDIMLHQTIPAARAAGVLTSVYHICWPKQNSASAEAAYFLKTAGKYVTSGALIPALDIEPGYCPDGPSMVAWIDQWENIVHKSTGVYPVIYCSSSVASKLVRADDGIDDRYRLWIAAYEHTEEPDIRGWNEWTFWQYADSSRVPGIAYQVDHNWFNGNEESLQKLVIGSVSAVTYKLVSSVSGSGHVTVASEQPSYKAGTSVVLAATPVEGWQFAGWDGDICCDNNPVMLTMNANKSVTAKFSKIPDPNQHIVTLVVGSKTAHVDAKSIALASPPVVVSGRTMVPIREIIEGLGGTVEWKEETKSVQIALSGKSLLLQIGSDKAVVDGAEVDIGTPAAVIKGRTMLPVRFVGEHLGAEVDWNQELKIVTLTIIIVPAT